MNAVLPEGWGWSTLGDIALVDSGPAFKSNQFGDASTGVRLLRGDNIEPGALRWHNAKTWPDALLPGHEHLHVFEGDLILAMDRPVVAAGLKLARVTARDLPSLLVQRVARIRPVGVDGTFLYHLMQTPGFAHHIRGSEVGTQVPHITLKSIRNFAVPLPPPDEQRRLVDLLEDHLSRLDAGEAILDHAERLMVGLREKVVRDAITGVGVSGPRNSDVPSAEGVEDGILASLPNGWQWLRLRDVAQVVGGVTKDAGRQGDAAFVEVPYLRVANVQRGRLALDKITRIRVAPAKADALRLMTGDVLLNEGGDRDKLGRGWIWEGQVQDCIHQNHVFRARIVEARIHPKLLSWAANTIGGRWCEQNGKQSVNLASISLSKIRLMPIPVAPAELQEALVRHIDDALAGCGRLEGALVAQRRRLMSLRRSLLAAAFSGQLTNASAPQELAHV